MRRDPRIALGDIIESIDRITYTSALSEEQFAESELVQDAVLRRLAIIGEAVKRVPGSIREANPDVPWRRIAGTRDILIHEYADVDLDLTWAVVRSELPRLRIRIEAILRGLPR